MCPSVSVLTGEDAERDAFVRICLTNDIGDGTGVSVTVVSFYSAKCQKQEHTSPSLQHSILFRRDMRAGPRRTCCFE
jgi:hypothetical protein